MLFPTCVRDWACSFIRPMFSYSPGCVGAHVGLGRLGWPLGREFWTLWRIFCPLSSSTFCIKAEHRLVRIDPHLSPTLPLYVAAFAGLVLLSEFRTRRCQSEVGDEGEQTCDPAVIILRINHLLCGRVLLRFLGFHNLTQTHCRIPSLMAVSEE